MMIFQTPGQVFYLLFQFRHGAEVYHESLGYRKRGYGHFCPKLFSSVPGVSPTFCSFLSESFSHVPNRSNLTAFPRLFLWVAGVVSGVLVDLYTDFRGRLCRASGVNRGGACHAVERLPVARSAYGFQTRKIKFLRDLLKGTAYLALLALTRADRL